MSEPWQRDIHWFHALQNLSGSATMDSTYIQQPSSSQLSWELHISKAVWPFEVFASQLLPFMTKKRAHSAWPCREPGASGIWLDLNRCRTAPRIQVATPCLMSLSVYSILLRLLQHYQFECNWTTDWGACAQCMNLLGCLQPLNYQLQYHTTVSSVPAHPMKFGLEWNWPYFE